MMIEATRAEDLIGFRVRCDYGQVGNMYGVLRAITPLGWLVIADEFGHETLIELTDAKTLVDGRHVCAKCEAKVNRVFTNGQCAECERAWARTRPIPYETCEAEDCEGRAYYSPLAKAFLCASHHAQRGTNTGLYVESRVREAACRSADVKDPRHDWRRAKSRFICRLCQVSTFEDPLKK